MVAVRRVATVLGGRRVLERDIRGAADLERAVQRGLPKLSLVRTVQAVLSDPGEARRFWEKVVPPATFKRRRKLLTAEESERVERLAWIIATAREVWDDEQLANRFLLTTHAALEDRRPFDVARSDLGARRVEELLWQLYYGIAA